ncbi:hypothetical protein ACE14D_22535 [Streptomyces sp. Act-28]
MTEAHESDDPRGTAARFGRAAQPAATSENTGATKAPSKVIGVVDAAAGTVRLKAEVANANANDARHTVRKTVRVTGRTRRRSRDDGRSGGRRGEGEGPRCRPARTDTGRMPTTGARSAATAWPGRARPRVPCRLLLPRRHRPPGTATRAPRAATRAPRGRRKRARSAVRPAGRWRRPARSAGGTSSPTRPRRTRRSPRRRPRPGRAAG